MTAVRQRVAPTQRDLEVLACVRRHIQAYGHAPTRGEIARELGFSRPTAEGHLQALQQHKLVRLRTAWRGIDVTARGNRA